MNPAALAVLAVAVLVAVAVLSRRVGIATPIVLVVVGVGLSYLPGFPTVEVPHEVILDALLPPILYAAAISVPVVDFRRNLGSIASLSVVLVVVTAFAMGLFFTAVLPGLGLAAAVALGAVISPPDAVAATSIGRRLGLPPRVLTVLEGEGLVNDATALVMLRSATAAAAGSLLTPWDALADFGYAVVVAVVLGVAIGAVVVAVRARLSDPVLDTAVSLVVPFAVFIPTQALGASGVLAVVVAGLFIGHANPSAFTAQARISERINWRTIQFLLENGVFLIIGLEVRGLIEDVETDVLGVGATVGIGALATLVLAAIRFAWIGPLIVGIKRRGQRTTTGVLRVRLGLGRLLEAVLPKRWARRVHGRRRLLLDRGRADLTLLHREHIDWRSGVVIGWSGMRGVVTLAAAQSLPEDTPYRPQLILIAFTVAVLTLTVQGSTLPLVIRLLKVQGADVAEDRRDLAMLLDEISDAGTEVLDDPAAALGRDEPVDEDIVERVRNASFLRAEAAWERSRQADQDEDGEDLETPHRQFRLLRLAVVQAERTQLLSAREQRLYPSRVLREAQTLLDLEETRLRAREANS